MKVLCSIVALFLTLTVSAQQNQKAVDNYSTIVPTTVNNNLLFSWDAGINTDATFYVQASTDGKTYKTIGIVWGTTPELNNVCMFKMKKENAKKDNVTYRVYVEAAQALTSK